MDRPRRLARRLLCRSRDRRGGHDAEDRHLVRDPGEAKLESAQLDLRPGLVGVVLLHGDCGWLVWRQGGFSGATVPLALFGVQLVLNVLWSCLFFGLENPGLAFVEVVLLWAAIAATMVTFWQRSIIAGALFVPYLAWVSFASVLNFTIWRLNG